MFLHQVSLGQPRLLFHSGAQVNALLVCWLHSFWGCGNDPLARLANLHTNFGPVTQRLLDQQFWCYFFFPVCWPEDKNWHVHSWSNILSHCFVFFTIFILGEVLGFENLVFSVFEFIHGLIETPKFKKTVKKFLDDLIYFLVLYMEITEEQVSLV